MTAELAGFRSGLSVSGSFPDDAKTTRGEYNVEVTYELGDSGTFSASNYKLEDSGDTLTGSITSAQVLKRVLVVTPTTVERVYGDDEPSEYEYTVAPKSGSSFVSGDDASTMFFTSNPLTRAAGNDVGEYAFSLVASPSYAAGIKAKYGFEVAAGAKYTITKKALTITTPVVLTKEYDGTTAAAGATIASGGEVTGEADGESFTLTVSGGTYPQSDVGSDLTISSPTFTLTASGGAKTSNYEYTLPTAATGSITKRALTITTPVVLTKEYDGTTAAAGATIASGGEVSGEVGSESFTLAVSGGTYPQSDVGSNLAIASPTFTLTASGGAKTSNYEYTLPTAATGSITAKEVTVAAAVLTKVYDGGTGIGGATLSGGAVSGEVSNQSLTLKVTGGTYAQSDVGTGITINSPTFALEAGSNTDKDNYALPSSITLSGTITKAEITDIAAVTVKTRPVDGTTDASFDTTAATGAGVVTAELSGFRGGLKVSGSFPDGAKTTADTYDVAVNYELGDSGTFKASNYTLSDAGDTLTGTVTDKPVLVLTPATITEDGGKSRVTARLSEASSEAVTVTVTAAAVSPAEAGDFTLSSNTKLTIAAGDTTSTETVRITANDNDVDAPNKEVTVSGTASVGNGESALADQTLTITDDDQRGLELSETGVTVMEAEGTGRTATYTVVLSTEPTAAVTVAVSSGEAGVATVAPTSLTFSTTNWKTKQTVTVTGVDDEVDNASDRKTEIGHRASGGDYGSESGKVAVTVTDDEGSASLSVADASVAEGDTGTADLEFAVKLSPASDGEVTVRWATSKESADTAEPGSDYTAGRGTLTFAAGETGKTVTVAVTGDAVDEPNETLTVTLSDQTSGVSITDAAATGTITDDDATPTVSLTLSPASIDEDGGVSTVTASLSGASSAEVIVTVSASPVNPAVSGDYTLSTNTKLTIAAGSKASSGTVTITANDNDVDTANKTVTVSGASSGGNGVTNPGSKTLTIEDDDERGLELSAETVTVTEAEGAGRTAKYTVVLSTEPTAEVTVAVSSGEAGVATVAPTSLTFSTTNWKTKQTVTVTGVDDAVDNAPDRKTEIGHRASGGDYGSLSKTVAVTVTDDEDTPTVSLALSPASIGEDGGVSTVTASLSGASSAEVIVTVSASPVNPAVSGDYTLSSNTKLTIAAGSTASSGTVRITANDNDVDAPNKEVTVSGVASGGNGVTNPADQTLTIEDDEETPTVSLGLSPASISEDGGVSTVTASLNGASSAEVIVTVSASPVNPAVSGDYTLSTNTKLTIAAGSTASSGTVTITANDNDVDTANKTVTVSGVASGGNGVTNPGSKTLTIEDDDERGLELSAETVTVTEAEGTGRTAKYTVVLSTEPTAEVTVAVSSGEAGVATVAPTSLTFSTTNWKTKQTVTVTGVDDEVDNASDRKTEIGHRASGGDYGSESGKVAVTVTDDEGSASLSVDDASVTEGDTGTADLEFAVKLSPASDGEVTVQWATSKESADTAEPGSDYTAGNGTLTFAAGETGKTVTVTVQGDAVDEPNETLTVTLSNQTSGVSITDATATGTITDDDTATVSLALSPASIGEDGGVSTVTASLSGTSSEAVEVTVSASPVNPAMNTDYTLSTNTKLTIAAGSTASSGTVTITANDNDVDAPNKEVTVSGAVERRQRSDESGIEDADDRG